MLSFASRVVAATVAATSFVCSSDAGVVFGSLQHSISIPATSTGLYLNVQTGQASYNESAVPGWDVNISGASGLNFISPGGYNFVRLNGAAPTAGPSALPAGFVVGPSSATPRGLPAAPRTASRCSAATTSSGSASQVPTARPGTAGFGSRSARRSRARIDGSWTSPSSRPRVRRSLRCRRRARSRCSRSPAPPSSAVAVALPDTDQRLLQHPH